MINLKNEQTYEFINKLAYKRRLTLTGRFELVNKKGAYTLVRLEGVIYMIKL